MQPAQGQFDPLHHNSSTAAAADVPSLPPMQVSWNDTTLVCCTSPAVEWAHGVGEGKARDRCAHAVRTDPPSACQCRKLTQ